jgi:RNA polymerase sigma factor (sigma-70 family)
MSTQLYDRYSRMIYAIAWKSLNSVEDCEEVVLDVFAQVWRIADRFDPEKGSVEKWLFTLARSRLLDRLRKLQRLTKVSDAIDAGKEIEFPTVSVDPIEAVGIVERRLFLDRVQRTRSMVVKVAAGVTYPLHRHRGVEEIYMLEGELIINDRVYLAGDYIRSAPDSLHAPSTNMSCMFLIRSCIDDEYFEN